jgi:3-isopropylmalate/(R)-2-methylmalate dehydratase small subunit
MRELLFSSQAQISEPAPPASMPSGHSQKAGLLTVILPQEVIEELWQVIESDPTTSVTVDLEAKNVRFGDATHSFTIDDYTRWRLMEGLDDIGLTLQKIDEVSAFEAERASFKPKTLPALQ